MSQPCVIFDVDGTACGGYATLEEAKTAYLSNAEKVFGEFARS